MVFAMCVRSFLRCFCLLSFCCFCCCVFLSVFRLCVSCLSLCIYLLISFFRSSPPRQLGYLDFTSGGPPSPSSSSSSPFLRSTPRSTPHHTTPHHTTLHHTWPNIASHMASQPDLWTAVDLAHIASHMAGQPDARSSVDLAGFSEKKIKIPKKTTSLEEIRN